MIYQEPVSALNPVFTIGSQLVEAILAHQSMTRAKAFERAEYLLSIVGIPDAAKRLKEYPHQLSGGMCQRAMIAMALCCEPRLLIADEPTTALDVTIQAQILDLIKRLQQELGMTVIFITHDLGIVAELADRVVVMYAGKVVEEGNRADILTAPLHPYTRGLLSCIPRPGHMGKLPTIEGMVPHGAHLPEGCRFHTRCAEAMERCRRQQPLPVSRGSQKVSCFLYAADHGGEVK
jgi:peptide/nickel transport system ATP-binding protein/oligopeptide transport system ATP-binding protein